MRPSARERISIGFRLSQASLAAWGTDRFWTYLSWWHEEIHYTIPAEELQREIESLFLKDTGLNLDSWPGPGTLGLGTTTLSTSLSLIPTSSSLTVSIQDCAGTWRWEGISVQTEKKPHLLRRWVIGVVLGARWEEREKPVPPEYEKLRRIFNVL
jgi:hypothetical protein